MTRTAGRLGAVLAFALLGACQSMDSLESLLDRDSRAAPPPKVAETAEPAAPQVREQRPAGEQTAQAETAQPRAAGDGPVRLQQQAPADAGNPPAPAGQQAEAETAPTDSQTRTAQTDQSGTGGPADPEPGAAGEVSEGTEDDGNGPRIAEGPKSESFGGDLTRRFNKLFGSSTSVRQPDQLVKTSDVTGAWLLEEEDGLRTCAVTLSPPESGSAVQPAGGCSGLAARAARWSIFGSDLLLSTADNTVVARLRRSGDIWIGFTLETGIPLVLSRQATSQG